MKDEITHQQLYTNLHHMDCGSVLLHPDVLEKIIPHVIEKQELLNLRVTCKTLKSAVDKLSDLEMALSTTWVVITEDNIQKFLDKANNLPLTAFQLKFATNMEYLYSSKFKQFWNKYGKTVLNLEVRVEEQCRWVGYELFQQHSLEQTTGPVMGLGCLRKRKSANRNRNPDGSFVQDVFCISHILEELPPHHCTLEYSDARKDLLCCSLTWCMKLNTT